MSPLKLLILTAVLPESQAISEGLHLKKAAAPFFFWTREDIALAQIGVRASRLNALAQLPAIQGVRGILLAGLAGALSPELHAGDIVVEGAPLRSPPAATRPGQIHMARGIVSTPSEKQHLFASTSCLAVDMESEFVRQFARDRGLPFLHVRAISDAADDELDSRFLQLVDEDGRPRIASAIAMICRRPTTLPAMLRLQKASTRALTNLSKCVAGIAASGWPAVVE